MYRVIVLGPRGAVSCRATVRCVPPKSDLTAAAAAPLSEDGFLTECVCSIWVGWDRAGRLCRRCGWSACVPSHRGRTGNPAGRPCHQCADVASRGKAEAKTAAAPARTGAGAGAGSCASTGDRSRSQVVTRRHRRKFRWRPTEWAEIGASVRDLLADTGDEVERVYLTGRPADPIGWAADLPDGWRHGQHYLTGAAPVWRFTNPVGRSVEIHTSRAWFGDLDVTPREGAAALDLVDALCRRLFDQGQILATPSATGRYLFMRSIPVGREWPVLPIETQELIRSTSGQGRIEFHGGNGASEAVRLWVYDGRLMYGACCWGLGAGLPQHDEIGDYAGQQRGRYRVSGTVPADWTGPGLIGVTDGDGGWHWPSAPGEPYAGWVDGAELGIILRHWPGTAIHERLLFPAYSGRGPLDTWSQHLVAMRGHAAQQANVGAVDERVGELARAAVRSILLHSIGAFHGRPHKVTRIARDDADVPAQADGWRIESGVHVWQEGTGQAWPEMAHPEWSAAIWGRARARLLDCPTGTAGQRAGLLHLDGGGQVVAVRTDSITVTAAQPWPDDGKPGRLRLKHETGPVSMPGTVRELLGVTNGKA